MAELNRAVTRSETSTAVAAPKPETHEVPEPSQLTQQAIETDTRVFDANGRLASGVVDNFQLARQRRYGF